MKFDVAIIMYVVHGPAELEVTPIHTYVNG